MWELISSQYFLLDDLPTNEADSPANAELATMEINVARKEALVGIPCGKCGGALAFDQQVRCGSCGEARHAHCAPRKKAAYWFCEAC